MSAPIRTSSRLGRSASELHRAAISWKSTQTERGRDLVEWSSTVWLAVVIVLLFWIPGLVVGYLGGLRGITAWGAAPLLTGGVVGTAAVVAGAVGISWSLLVVVGATLVAGTLSYLIFRVACRWRSPHVASGAPVRRSLALWLALAALAAIPLQAKRLVDAIGAVTDFPQTFDAPYHFNSVELILATGDASSLHMVLTTPGATSNFYPALWHVMVASVEQLAPHVSTVVVANWMTLVIACLVWPASMLVLARFLFGPRVLPLALTLAFSFSFVQFPDTMTRFGILYPNLLSYAVLPAFLGLVLNTLWRSRGRRRLAPFALTVVGVLALVFAQPNGLFAVGYILVPVLIHYAVHSGRLLRRRGRSWPVTVSPLVVVMVGCVAVYWASGKLAIIDDFRSRVSWDARFTSGEGVDLLLRVSAMHPTHQANWFVAVLVAVGFVRAFFVARWRWVPFAYALLGALFVIGTSASEPVRALWTGYWYGDAQRLASLLPLLGLPLMVLGAATVVQAIIRLVPAASTARGKRASRALIPAVAVALVAVPTVVLPRTAVDRDVFQLIAKTYAVQPGVGFISTDEVDLMADIERIVPNDVVVAGNPWNGSSMTWALAGRRPLFPHFGASLTPDQALIAQQLGAIQDNPAVCDALRRQNVWFVYMSTTYLWENAAGGYEALTPDVLDTVGVLVASDGEARLYKITACAE